MAVTGYVDEISRHLVSGWAVDLEHPEATVEVALHVDGKCHALLPCAIHRSDLNATLREKVTDPEARQKISGSYGFHLALHPPLPAFKSLLIEVRAGPARTLLPNGRRTLPPPPSQQASFRPILVNGVGRSGTTLLMQKLSAHPDIVVAPIYPYEITLLTYYTAAFRTLISGQDRERSTDPTTLFSADQQYSIGFNPFNRPGLFNVARNPARIAQVFEEFIPARMAQCFRAIIEEYYCVLRQDQGKSDAPWFAEKSGLDETARQGPRIFFGAVREIILIRDPRDLICSARSFWKLNWDDAHQRVAMAARQLLDIQQTAGEDVLFVKYEDLVTSTSDTLARICAFLCLSVPDNAGDERESRLFKSHGTSASPDSSVGRWRREMAPEEIAASAHGFRDFLDHFAYPSHDENAHAHKDLR